MDVVVGVYGRGDGEIVQHDGVFVVFDADEEARGVCVGRIRSVGGEEVCEFVVVLEGEHLRMTSVSACVCACACTLEEEEVGPRGEGRWSCV